ncbi:MAG: zf-HC2 domain-containing protein [Alphaproteobacteria bacterium]|nr:zf-HC2 domain-containing protein [Alphaproteobacteria bacterium]
MAHLSTLKLNQLRYGELTADDEAAARAHLDTCERCADRLRAQEANRAAFVLQPVPPALKAPAPSPWRRWWVAVTPVLALAALILIIPRLTSLNDQGTGTVSGLSEDHETDRTRIKGARVELEAWLNTPRGERALNKGDAVATGDVIQFRFDAGDHRYVTFAGVDGTGQVEVYGTFTANGPQAGVSAAPFALTLDDTPGDQTFFAYFTESAPQPGEVKASALQRTSLSNGTFRTITLSKR